MQQTILMNAPGRSSQSPLVIINGIDLAAKFSTTLRRISRALSIAWNRAKCFCTPRSIIRALFCDKTAAAVWTVIVVAMWWHNITIDNTIDAQRAIAIDCLYGMPWAIAWVLRTITTDHKEGGKA